VNPLDPNAIADAIRLLRDAPDRVRAMGEAGRRAVDEVFNWPQAERALLAFYDELLR
jgi:glycosyltransferase involved in cell wall biosynthesis